MDKGELGASGLRLLEGESLDTVLSLRYGVLKGFYQDDREVLYLTNKRVVQISGGKEPREMVAADLKEIQSVSSKWDSRKTSTLIWGIVGLIGGLVLYRVIMSSFESTVLAVILGLLAGLLGIYLVLDYFLSRDQVVVILRAGGMEIKGHVQGKDLWADTYKFIDRVFAMKMGEDIAASHVTAEERSPSVKRGPGPSEPEHRDAVVSPLAVPGTSDTSKNEVREEALSLQASGEREKETPIVSSEAASPSGGSEQRPDPSLSEHPPSEDDSQRRQS